MPQRIGVFSENNAKRIARGYRSLEGMPGTFLGVPERMPRHYKPPSTPGDPASGMPWTVSEYTASTGEILTNFDRGRRRHQSSATIDTDAVLSSDGNYLYCCGQGLINQDTGVLIKYNVETGERLWYSDAGAFDGPIEASTTNNVNTASRICEASDGFIWVMGTDSSNTCVGRFNPTTGAQTHYYSLGVSTSFAHGLAALPSDGKVLVVLSTAARVLDDTATQIASVADAWSNYTIFGSSIIGVRTSGVDTLLIYDLTLTSTDSRAAPGTEVYGAVACDGTNVYVTTAGGVGGRMYRAYDFTNLASETWNAARTSSGEIDAPRALIYANSYLYNFNVRLRKVDPSDGSEVWSTASTSHTSNPVGRGCAVGSNFAVAVTADTTRQVFCYSDSDGSLQWYDQEDNDTLYGVTVSDDDRCFVFGRRRGP